MADLFALLDAVPGRENDVLAKIQTAPRVLARVRVREQNFDFLVQVRAPSVLEAREYIQTQLREIPGVARVEEVIDPDDYSSHFRETLSKLRGAAPT